MSEAPKSPQNAGLTPFVPKPRKRWGRRLLLVGGVLVVLLLILVALAPTLAGTAPLRALALSRVNGMLNGSVTVDDTSFGWFSGQRVGGVKVFDEQKSLILEVNRIETDLGLASALRGNLALGTTLIDLNLTRLQIDAEGNTNLDQLVKSSPASMPSGAGKPASAAGDGRLPNVSGKITVKYRGTIEYVDRIGGTPIAPPLVLEPGEAVLDVPDINSAVSNTIKLALRVGDRPAGSVDIGGKIDAIDGNQLNLEKLVADQSVKISAIDLSALAPILRVLKVEGDVGGMVNGQIALTADGTTRTGVDGAITITDLSAGGIPALKGDSFRTKQVTIPIQVTRAVVDAQTTLLKITSLRVEMPEARVVIAGEMTQQSLENIAAARQPGADGWLSTTIAVTDLPGISQQLRNALGLAVGVTVTGGELSQTFDVTLRADKAFAKARLDVSASGTRDGGRIAVAPIGLSLDATYTPTANPLQGVENAAIDLQSGFATAKGGGKTLDKLDIAGDFDLKKLEQQLAQFVDLGGMGLAGAGTFVVGTKGDLQQPNSDIAANLRVQMRDVDVKLPEQPQVAVGDLSVNVDSTLRTNDKGGIAKIAAATITANSAEGGQKVLDLLATITNVDLATTSVGNFELKNLAVASLRQLQRQFGVLVPALAEQQINVTDGQLYATVSGSWDGATQTLSLARPLELSTPNLTVTKGDAVVLNREKLVVRAGGKIALGGGTSADLADLSVTSSILTLTKSAAPLQVRVDDSGAVTGTGQLKLAADLPRVNAALQAFGDTPAQVRGGKADLTIDLAGGLGAESTVTLAGVLDQLSIAGAGGQGMENERLAITANLKTSADLSQLSATANIDSSFARVSLTRADAQLSTAAKPVGTYDMLRALSADVAITDLPKLYALATAFTPAAGASAAGAPGAKPSEPIAITSGGASMKIDVLREGSALRINAPDIRISKLALARGEKRYAFDRDTPISLALVAQADAAGEELKSLKVTQLNGDLRVATLSMPAPIGIELTDGKPSATGGVQLAGKLDDLNGLLAVLDALPAGTTLGGNMLFAANATTSGETVTAKLDGRIDQFQLRQPDQPPLPPRQVVVDGQARLNSTSNVLSVDRFVLKLPENDTLTIDLSGGAVALNDLLVKLDGTTLKYTYDLEQIWPLVLPLIDPESQKSLADTRIQGKLSRTIALQGSYNASKPFNEAIAGVSGEGAFDVELLDSQGMTINKLSIPFAMSRGVVKISKTEPAIANNGTLNLNGLVLDLTTPEPRLSGPRKQRLLHNVSINPALGNTLGKYVNPSFPNSERAQGLLDVTIDELDRVALGDAMFGEDSGKARIVFSITDMDIANPLGGLMFGKVAGGLNMGSWTKGQGETFKGAIKDAVVTLDKGRTTQQLTMQLQEDVEATDPVTGKKITIPKNMPLTFAGDIRLRDLSQKLSVSLPPELVGRFLRISDKDMKRFFPDGVPIALRGTTTKPEVDIGNLAQKLIEAQLRSRLTGDGGKGDPVGGLIDSVLGGKKEKKN